MVPSALRAIDAPNPSNAVNGFPVSVYDKTPFVYTFTSLGRLKSDGPIFAAITVPSELMAIEVPK